MAILARYVWSKTENGYGWNAWQGCGLTIEQIDRSGLWGVFEADGSKLCVCTSYKGAQRVVARVRREALTRLNPQGGLDFALLTQDREGIAYHGYSEQPQFLSDCGTRFPTRQLAEEFIAKQEQTITNGLLRS